MRLSLAMVLLVGCAAPAQSSAPPMAEANAKQRLAECEYDARSLIWTHGDPCKPDPPR